MRTVDEFIARCDEVIAETGRFNPSQLADLSSEICSSFNNAIPNISRYRGLNINGEIRPYTVEDIRRLRGKLAVYRDEKDHELEIAKLNAAAAGVNVAVDNVNNNIATANATVTVSQAAEALDSCDLSSESLAAIKAAVLDLETAKNKSPETVCEKASKLLDLAKKGADTAKAVAPFVAAALSALGL